LIDQPSVILIVFPWLNLRIINYIVIMNSYKVNTNSSKVLLSVLILLGCLKSNLRWKIVTLGISMAYGNLSSFCETLGKYILTNDPWNMTSVTWNMLET
jgi:hypothetical protein